MVVKQHAPATLRAGERLTRDEFLRRWEAMPNLKKAELIGGIVYMPSPVSFAHGKMEQLLGIWLGTYTASTPSCDSANNSTWHMLGDSPQPDAHLRLLPEFGGQSSDDGTYLTGAPELITEACGSSATYDLTQKKNLYAAAGVKEYVAVLMEEPEVRWHRLLEGEYKIVPSEHDGIMRSAIFPGLWLDPAALLEGNITDVLDVLQRGLKSPEHANHVARLSQKKS